MPEFNPWPKSTPKEKTPSKPLKRTALKRKPYELKKSPIKASTKPIKQVSAKQAKVEKEKSKVYRQRSENERPFCRGCGSYTDPLSNSHRIGQAKKEHAANPANLDTFCMDGNDCHRLFENGYLWRLDNGLEVLEWLESTDHERFMSKVYKMADRIRENSLSLEDLPEWVGSLFERLEIQVF